MGASKRRRRTTRAGTSTTTAPSRESVQVRTAAAQTPAKSRPRLPRANRASSQAVRSWRPVRVLSAESQSTAVRKQVSGMATASAGSTATPQSQPGSEVPTVSGYRRGAFGERV